jgi:hypothetical protein
MGHGLYGLAPSSNGIRSDSLIYLDPPVDGGVAGGANGAGRGPGSGHGL